MAHFALVTLAGIVHSRTEIEGNKYDPGPDYSAIEVVADSPVSGGWTWSENEGFKEPPPPPSPEVIVPKSVTLAQARVALRRAGIFDQVNEAIVNVGGEAKEAWEYSNTVSRDSLLVKSMGGALSLSEKQIDDLFFAAVAIEF